MTRCCAAYGLRRKIREIRSSRVCGLRVRTLSRAPFADQPLNLLDTRERNKIKGDLIKITASARLNKDKGRHAIQPKRQWINLRCIPTNDPALLQQLDPP